MARAAERRFRLDEVTRSGVMPGLVPGIHAKTTTDQQIKTWMAGTSPAMTSAVIVGRLITCTYNDST
jgi:orotidine-5'-phosphate decarboxylase